MGVFSKLKSNGLNIFGATRLTSKNSCAPRLLFVSHEATRTGAPMIALNILKHFRDACELDCDTILHNGGHLVSEFERYSRVECLNIPRNSSEDLARKVRRAVFRSKTGPPLLAICNSMESRFIAYELARLDLPVIFLVHELPSSYSEEDYQAVFEYSRRVIFPVHAVKEATERKVAIPPHKALVLPQGLLNPQFGTSMSRDAARTGIRKELGLPEDSFVVLGCGTLDLRKGIDHFAAVARMLISQRRIGRPAHFVWVGEGPRWTHSPYHYVSLDIEKTVARGHVHFIGERENVEPFFLGSDAFLMTSRVDPFPCVIHEAMASELPIITFDKSGGAPEAVGDGAGIVIPYGDYQQAVNMLELLATQTEIAESLRRRSQEKVYSNYRFADYADKLMEIAESAIGTRIRSAVQPPPATLPLHRAA